MKLKDWIGRVVWGEPGEFPQLSPEEIARGLAATLKYREELKRTGAKPKLKLIGRVRRFLHRSGICPRPRYGCLYVYRSEEEIARLMAKRTLPIASTSIRQRP